MGFFKGLGDAQSFAEGLCRRGCVGRSGGLVCVATDRRAVSALHAGTSRAFDLSGGVQSNVEFAERIPVAGFFPRSESGSGERAREAGWGSLQSRTKSRGPL